MLDSYKMVVAAFSVVDKANRVRFFKKTFVVANVSPEVVLGMLFLTLSEVDVDFSRQKLSWSTYTIKVAFPTIRRVKLVRKKEFVAAALNPEHETYVVHVASLNSTSLVAFDIHPFQRLQIFGLIAKKVSTKVFAKHLDFTDVFSPDLASELPKYTRIKDHAIKLVDSQQLPYGSIYSLRPVELEIVKAYIETNLANGFIRLSKSPASTFILFDRKSNSLFQFCVNYRGLNNLTIKNKYLLPLIWELLDRLGKAGQFI